MRKLVLVVGILGILVAVGLAGCAQEKQKQAQEKLSDLQKEIHWEPTQEAQVVLSKEAQAILSELSSTIYHSRGKETLSEQVIIFYENGTFKKVKFNAGIEIGTVEVKSPNELILWYKRVVIIPGTGTTKPYREEIILNDEGFRLIVPQDIAQLLVGLTETEIKFYKREKLPGLTDPLSRKMVGAYYWPSEEERKKCQSLPPFWTDSAILDRYLILKPNGVFTSSHKKTITWQGTWRIVEPSPGKYLLRLHLTTHNSTEYFGAITLRIWFNAQTYLLDDTDHAYIKIP